LNTGSPSKNHLNTEYWLLLNKSTVYAIYVSGSRDGGHGRWLYSGSSKL